MPKINALNFIDSTSLAADTTFNSTNVRDLSGIVYDSVNDVYYAVSNDLTNPRFYTLDINLTANSLDSVTVTGVTNLNDSAGNPLADNTTDLEGIALTSNGTIFLASEGVLDESGVTENHINPFVREFNLTTGNQVDDLTIPDKFIPEGALSDSFVVTAALGNPITPTTGIRSNFGFESLTLTEDEAFLFTAVEASLAQDSSSSNIVSGGTLFNRILQFEPSANTYAATAEYLYIPEAFHNVTDILALDSETLIVVERNPLAASGFSPTFDIQIYEADLSVATDITGTDALNNTQGSIVEVEKTLLVDFDDLNNIDGNFEGLTFGSDVNGNRSLIVISDNGGADASQFVAFEIELATAATVDFAEATYTFAEADGTVELILNRTGDDLTGESVVTVSATGGTATVDADYTNSFPANVTFAANQTSQTVTVDILDDGDAESLEDITFNIAAVGDVTIGTQATTTVSITDNDNDTSTTTTTVDFAEATYTFAEGDGTVELILNRTGDDLTGESVVTVSATGGSATADTDYTNSFPANVTFAANQTSQTVTVDLLDDGDVEETEDITFTLAGVGDVTVGNQATSTVNITDNDSNDSDDLGTTNLTITIENLAPENGLFLAQFWTAFHDGNFDVFNVGETASPGLDILAEDGITGLEYQLENALEFITEVANQSNLDLDSLLPILQQLTDAGVDLSTVTSAFSELQDANLDAETQQNLVDALDNLDANSDLTSLAPVLTQLSDAGVNTTVVISAFTSITDAGVDLSVLSSVAEQFLTSGLDLDIYFNALQPLLDSGVDINTIIAALEDPENSNLDLSSVSPIENTLGFEFTQSNSGSNGGEQFILANNGVVTDLLGQDPGQSVSLNITLDNNNLANTRYFSYASMIVPSNDGFIGNEDATAIEIFDGEGNFLGADIIVLGDEVWDAGTEVNDESPDSIPYTLDLIGQGVDENGTVQLHPPFLPAGSGGILDIPQAANADFTQSGYQVARITITETPDLIVFGDSLSDTGNSFDLTGIPPAPYFDGRTSNGILAVEIFAAEAGLNLERENNYAFVGATTGRDNTNDDNTGLDLPGLLDQVDDFAATLGNDGADANDTYFIWAGANDFIDPLADPANADIPTIISDGVTNLITSVSTLNALGAENIVLANLVNLGLLPAADGIEAQATAISTTFNDALETALDSLDFEVTLLDFFGIGNAVAANPGDFDFSNIDDALLLEATTPENPEEFFFWDTIHPTTQGHAFFAETIAQTLAGETFEPFLFSADLTASQEVDPGDNDATGTAELRLNELGTGLRYTLTVSGLDFGNLAGVTPQTTETDDDVVGLHIHQGNRGENGDVVFGIANPSQDEDDFTVVINDDGSATISGVWEESDPANQSLSNFVTDLQSTADGEDTDLYFNIHTAGFPSGAIRGQITGGETTTVTPPVDDGVTVNDDNSFTLSGTGAVNLEFNLVGVNATFVNEIGIYRREDGQTTQDILENGQVIFSALGNLGDFALPSRILSNFSAGDEIGFYLVANTTKDAVLAGEFGTEQVILGSTTTIQTIAGNGGEFTLNFEDAAGTDFDDVQITMAVTDNEPAIGSSLQGEVELIDLRDFESQSINAEVRVTRNASFDNVGGLYLAVDETGTVVDSVTGNLVQPGDSNYAEVALTQSVVDFTAESFASTVLQGGFVYVPYILSNGDTTQFYTTFATANPDGLEHIISLGDNSFGFEDLPDGGDRDFNDLLFGFDFSVV